VSEHWKKLDTRMVNIDNIHVIDRIMMPTQKRIDAMAISLSGPMGQINSVLITKHLYSAWKVVAGATRVLAAEQLKWKQIEATIIGADNNFEYQLIEIAENLHRHDLSDNERVRLKKFEAELFAKRRAFFDELLEENPELVTGNAKGGRGKKGGIRDAARQSGVSKSAAQDRAKSPTRKHNKKPPATDQAGSLPEPAGSDKVAIVTPVSLPTAMSIPKKTAEPETLYCSFCGKSQHEVRKLVAGPTVYICDECINLCVDIVREEDAAPKAEPLESAHTEQLKAEHVETIDRGPDAPALRPCPTCHGTGTVEIAVDKDAETLSIDLRNSESD
jgi:hypothetical protein